MPKIQQKAFFDLLLAAFVANYHTCCIGTLSNLSAATLPTALLPSSSVCPAAPILPAPPPPPPLPPHVPDHHLSITT